MGPIYRHREQGTFKEKRWNIGEIQNQPSRDDLIEEENKDDAYHCIYDNDDVDCDHDVIDSKCKSIGKKGPEPTINFLPPQPLPLFRAKLPKKPSW